MIRGMNESGDPTKTIAILLLQSDILSASGEKWQRVAELFAMRLQHPVAIVDTQCNDADSADLQTTVAWYSSQGYRRFVLMPLGLEPFDMDGLLQVVVWMRSQELSIHIHIARVWTTKDWCETLAPPLVEKCTDSLQAQPDGAKARRSALLLVSPNAESTNAIGLELASIAFHFYQFDIGLEARYCFLATHRPRLEEAIHGLDVDGMETVVIVPWRMGSRQVEELFANLGFMHATELRWEPNGAAWIWNRSTNQQPEAIEWLEHPAWMHVALGFYLDALATRSVERYFVHPASTDKPIFRELIELDMRIDSVLPSEYQGRTDEVESQSMGSTAIPSDQFGQVPWDEIWTSFCDLAMAGGPPHRGRLLEAVSAQEVATDPNGYDKVVSEIRRGIEMVTGLQTTTSSVLGWIGVECDSEPMCVWLMRAIIVENVMVRREGKTLYLPAGPTFRVKKEIKNVITSLAKTVHYWRSHLRLESPGAR